MDTKEEEDDDDDEGDDEVKKECDETELKDTDALDVRDVRYSIEKLGSLDLGYLGIFEVKE